MPSRRSRHVLYLENFSYSTRTRDIEDEFERYGRVRNLKVNHRKGMSLVEFDRHDDADFARRRLDGVRIDGSAWTVEFATESDLRRFGWTMSRSPSRSYSRSRSPYSRSPSRSRSRSRSRGVREDYKLSKSDFKTDISEPATPHRLRQVDAPEKH